MNEWEDLDVNEFEWEELDVNEVFGLINNNVSNPSPELRDQLYGLITETQNLVIEINEGPRQRELEEAVLAERDACALACIEVGNNSALTGKQARVTTLCANAILARGEKPWVKTYAGGKPNYCTPEETRNKLSWVGLTDEERKQIVSYINDPFEWSHAVEAKLKEKNNGN